MERLKNLLKNQWEENRPLCIFAGGLLILIVVAVLISFASASHHQPAAQPEQPVTQPARQEKPEIQPALPETRSEVQPAGQEETQTQPVPVAEATNSYKGIALLRSGPANTMKGFFRPLGNTEEDYHKWPKGLGLSCMNRDSGTWTPENSRAKVYFLTNRRTIEFKLATEDYTTDYYTLDDYACLTNIKITADGKTIKELSITKDDLLKQMPVRIEGAKQVILEFSTAGKKVGDEVQDEEGKWFPVVLLDFKVSPA